MANVRNANTYHIDTASSGGPPATTNILDVNNVLVVYIMVTSSSTGAVLELANNSSSQQTKIRIEISSANTTERYNFESAPIIFPNGIAIATLTNCEATLVVRNPNA